MAALFSVRLSWRKLDVGAGRIESSLLQLRRGWLRHDTHRAFFRDRFLRIGIRLLLNWQTPCPAC